MDNIIDRFKAAMAEAGIDPPASVVTDGHIHRFGKSKNAWYILHADDPAAGAFGDWRRGISETWSCKSGQSMTPAEKAAYAAKMETVKRLRDEELERLRTECRQWCTDIWAEAEPAINGHPYLVKKNVKSHGLRQDGDILLVPVLDFDGTLHGLQKISPDGSKRFAPGTNKAGHFFKIGQSRDNTVIIAEGYATGATLREATEHSVVVAFDAGNLLSVAQTIRAKYPDMKIIIAADDDHMTEGNPGLNKAAEATKAVNGLLAVPAFPNHRGPKDSDFNDMARLSVLDEVKRQIEAVVTAEVEEPPEDQSLARAEAVFPYCETFPWGTLPTGISNSLVKLGKSCATSPNNLPGTALAVLSSALGRTVCISPKTGWTEPLHVWCMDVRNSGEGKTPAMTALARPLHELQRKSDEEFQQQHDLWVSTPKENRGEEPVWSRSYFVSGLTLEGVRSAMRQGHGGCVCLMNELSSFISSQNQYKSHGDDREGWLALHDGTPARIIRAKESVTIQGARLSLCGGIQPEVFRSVFASSKNGLLLDDGTLYRFLMVYEPPRSYELTRESWGDSDRQTWENLAAKAVRWADERFQQTEEPLILQLSEEAWETFMNFRNDLYAKKESFPVAFKGFIPKAVSYVLRLGGLIHVMAHLTISDSVNPVVSAATIEKAIAVVSFYEGHILRAVTEMVNREEQDEAKGILMAALDSLLKKEPGQIHFTVREIANGYNAQSSGETLSAKKVGVLLRQHGLHPERRAANRAYVISTVKIKKFLKQCSGCSGSSETLVAVRTDTRNIENGTLQEVPEHGENSQEQVEPENNPERCGTLQTQRSDDETQSQQGFGNIWNVGNVGNGVSEENKILRVPPASPRPPERPKSEKPAPPMIDLEKNQAGLFEVNVPLEVVR